VSPLYVASPSVPPKYRSEPSYAISTGASWHKIAWNARKKAFFVDEEAKAGGAESSRLEEAELQGAPTLLTSPTTRAPLKVALFNRQRSESSSVGFQRRPEASLDRLTRSWKSGEVELEPHSSSSRSSLSSDRASRDYTNLHFQDPEFYQSPKIIEQGKRANDVQLYIGMNLIAKMNLFIYLEDVRSKSYL
jgi:hypothetical protein